MSSYYRYVALARQPARHKYQDAQLIALLQQGDRCAFSGLYDDYAPVFYSAISRLIPDQQAHESLLAEVFAAIRREVHSYQPREQQLFTWMYAILQRTIRDWHDPIQYPTIRPCRRMSPLNNG